MLKIIFLCIALFYVIPTIMSIIGEIYTSHYHQFFNDGLKEKLKDAKTVGDFLNCFQMSFFPLANIGFMFIYICIFLHDLLKYVFKFITKITKLDILWKKLMNIKIRK
jgi:hypothetical protein